MSVRLGDFIYGLRWHRFGKHHRPRPDSKGEYRLSRLNFRTRAYKQTLPPLPHEWTQDDAGDGEGCLHSLHACGSCLVVLHECQGEIDCIAIIDTVAVPQPGWRRIEPSELGVPTALVSLNDSIYYFDHCHSGGGGSYELKFTMATTGDTYLTRRLFEVTEVRSGALSVAVSPDRILIVGGTVEPPEDISEYAPEAAPSDLEYHVSDDSWRRISSVLPANVDPDDGNLFCDMTWARLYLFDSQSGELLVSHVPLRKEDPKWTPAQWQRINFDPSSMKWTMARTEQ